MPSAARGPINATHCRWLKSQAGTWHAYWWEWDPASSHNRPGSNLPVCGANIPRTRLGRFVGPPTGEEVCRACAISVGFIRRPKMAAYLAKKFGKRELRTDQALLVLEERVKEIERRVAALEAIQAQAVRAQLLALEAAGVPADGGEPGGGT